MKLKQFFRYFRCWIIGGHTYADKNLETTYNIRDMTYNFRNRCTKCGHKYEFEIPEVDLLFGATEV